MNRTKKRWLIAIALLLVVLLVVIVLSLRACSQNTRTTDANSPTLTLSQPPNNSVLPPGQSINIVADAGGASDSLRSVEIRVNNSPIKTLASAPYVASWTPFDAGVFQIDAIATDRSGGTIEAVPVVVTVQTAKPDASGPTTLTVDNSPIPWRSWYYLPPTGFWGVYGAASLKTPDIVSTVQRLKFANFPATIVYTHEWSYLDPGRWYIVFIGPYSSEPLARQAAAYAKSAGFAGMYVRFSGPRRTK
jgi:hypothetical protein